MLQGTEIVLVCLLLTTILLSVTSIEFSQWCTKGKDSVTIYDDHNKDTPIETINCEENITVERPKPVNGETETVIDIEYHVDKNVIHIKLTTSLRTKTSSLYTYKMEFKQTQKSKSCIFTLKVRPSNQFPPYFKTHESKFSISENNGTRFEIVKLQAEDDDKIPINKITEMGINDENSLDGKFELNWEKMSNSASLFLIAPLDYEEKQFYRIEIFAKDQGRNESEEPLCATTAVFIDVKDEDDQMPVFTKVCSISTMKEMEKIGHEMFEVKAIDGDFGINNEIRYSIVTASEDMHNEYFKIGEQNGITTITKEINREEPTLKLVNDPVLVITVEASEWNGVQRVLNRTTKIECNVIIEDINDNPAEFNYKQYKATVRENAQANIPVEFTEEPYVIDLDMGENAKFELKVVNHSDIFEVSPAIGMNKLPFFIRVKNSSVLKYDCSTECKEKVFSLQLEARETKQNGSGKYGTDYATVCITMIDENDHFPEFENITEAKVSENVSAGAFVAMIRATDKDMDFFGTKGIRYSLVEGSFSNSFAIDENTGNLTVKTNDHGFNREKISSFYITIAAQDNNGTGNLNMLLLKIILLDANDQVPTFVLQFYKAYMFENSKKFTENLVLLATDLDEENTNNSRVKYQLVDSNNFILCETNSYEGVLMTPVKEIDFEDPNLPEPKCGDSMSVCTRLFELEVMAYDLGIPQQSSTVNVNIELRDENDNGPKFKKETCDKIVTINETASKGTKIFKVEAHDADISPAYKKVFYIITEGAENNFIIDRDQGNITVAGNAILDPDYNCNETHCDKKLTHVLKVEASDSLMNKEDGEICEIRVIVKDINNKPPKFRLEERSFEVTENVENAPITNLTAYDFDSNNKLRFRINFTSSIAYMPNFRPVDVEKYNYKKLFNLNKETGELQVQGMLDRESMKRIEMFLTVEDENAEVGRPQTAQDRIEIVVCDVNDNNPYFVNNDTDDGYLAFVWEESPKNQTLKNIVAKDDDEDNEITYSLNENERLIQELFVLGEKSGDLTIIKKVDYEEHQWLNFTVTATDSGNPNHSSNTFVFLEVGDVNDNDPVFLNESYKVEILEEGMNYSLLLTVKATDKDSNTYGMYGLVNYRLQRGITYTKFSVDKENGSILNIDRLDREVQETYEFVVEAFDTPDDPTKSRKATTQVSVTLLDINDNDPAFELWKENCVKVPEDKEVGSEVAKVQATDPDKGCNGTVQYFFNEDEEVEKLFQIDRATGVITVKSSLLQYHKEFNVSVRAEDKGSPPLYKNQIFCIFVEDVNLNYPKFIKPEETETFYIQEEDTPKENVIKVMAKDNDSSLTENSKIKYEICFECEDGEISSKTFSVNENTGEISVKVKLKKSERPEYLLTIKACDKGTPPKCTEEDTDHVHAKIKIIVRNKDDTLPQFHGRTNVVAFEEETLEGKVFIPEAKYQEEFMGNITSRTICYFIIGGDTEYFVLDKISRELTLQKKLDREKIAFHNVIVKAQETCSQKPEAVAEFNRNDLTTVNITVNVIDINDNPPMFTEQRFTGGVKVTDKYQKRVLRVVATDLDEGENAVVHYKLVGDFKVKKDENIEHIETPFYVNSVSGEVALNFYPKSDMKGHFDFDVMAYDKDNLNSTTQVLIYLLREDQQVHLTLKIKVDDFSEEKRMKLKRLLENVLSEIVIIDDYRAYAGDDNRYNPQEYTDILFHVVQEEDNSVMEAEETLKLIDKYWGNILENTVNDFYIVGAQKAKDDDISDSWEKQLKFILFGVSSGLLLVLFITSLVFYLKITSLTRKLRAATATSFGSQDSGLNRIGINNLPNTNKHTVEGSNPMWNCQTQLNSQEDAYSMNGSEISLDLKNFDGYSDFTFANNLSDPDVSIPNNIIMQSPVTSEKEMEALAIQNQSSPPPMVSKQNTFNTLKSMESKWRRRLTQGEVQLPPPCDPNRRRSMFLPSQPSSEL